MKSCQTIRIVSCARRIVGSVAAGSLYRWVLLAVAGASVACGGRIDEHGDDGCGDLSPCEAAPLDATADRSAGSTEGGALRDHSVDAQPGDAAAVQEADIPDRSPGDAGVPATQATLPPTTACLTGGNVLWVQADPASFWYAGNETLIDTSTWWTEAYAYHHEWDGVYLRVAAPVAPSPWYLSFNSGTLDAGLNTGVVYDMAQGGGDSIGYLRTCGGTAGLIGQFRMDELTATDDDAGVGTLLSLTATFWAQCTSPSDPGPTGILQGCVHYEQ